MEALDRVFDVLSEERRRYALYYLEQQNGPVPVGEVAEQVTKWESNPGVVTISKQKVHKIEFRLEHCDLPKADDAEYVEYDPEAEVVEVTGDHEFNAILSVAKAIERPERYP